LILQVPVEGLINSAVSLIGSDHEVAVVGSPISAPNHHPFSVLDLSENVFAIVDLLGRNFGYEELVETRTGKHQVGVSDL
jgi:hypothetical protein